MTRKSFIIPVFYLILTASYLPNLCFAAGPNIFLESEDSLREKNIKPQDVIHWHDNGAKMSSDGTVVVSLRLVTEKEFTLYTHEVVFSSPDSPELDKMITPPTRKLKDPITDKEVEVYAEGDFELTFKTTGANLKDEFPLNIRYIGCTNRICLFPYTEKLSLKIFRDPQTGAEIAKKTPESSPDFSAASVAPSNDSNSSSADSVAPSNSFNSLSMEESLVSYLDGKETNIFLLMLVLFLGGFLTNLTPCVYPMIPITIRLLGRQSRSPLLSALAYAFGIIVVYTSLGVFASLSGSVFGEYMAGKAFSLVLALLMALLAVTMLGFGNLSFLQKLGLNMEQGQKKDGLAKALLMGCGAGFVAAPCTGPILAMLLSYIATGKGLAISVLYLFIYSAGFALPYIFLGKMSSSLMKVKVSPMVQVTVKVLFASVMFALAFYYLRIPLYVYVKQLLPYWENIALGSGIVCVLLFAAAYSFKKISEKSWLVLPTLLLGMSLFSYSQWRTHPTHGTQNLEPLTWIKDEAAAFAKAQQENAPLLIDMWAEWCEACKKMDVQTFGNEELIAEAKKHGWVLLRLDLTEANENNDKIQNKYSVQSLPTVVLIPDGRKSDEKNSINGFVSAARLLNEMRMIR